MGQRRGKRQRRGVRSHAGEIAESGKLQTIAIEHHVRSINLQSCRQSLLPGCGLEFLYRCSMKCGAEDISGEEPALSLAPYQEMLGRRSNQRRLDKQPAEATERSDLGSNPHSRSAGG